jgi:hypothetical protein
MNSFVCTVCKEAGHRLDRCPELCAPLRPGFMAPSGGGGHSHDDDDEKLKIIETNPVNMIPRCPTLGFQFPLKKQSV